MEEKGVTMNNFYEDLFKKQSEMLEKMGLSFFTNENQFIDGNFMKSYMENTKKFQEDFVNKYFDKEKVKENLKAINPMLGDYYDRYVENLLNMNAFDFNEYLKSPEEFSKMYRDSFDSYMRAYDLYKDIYKAPELAKENFEKSLEKYKDLSISYLKENVFKLMPEALKKEFEKSLDDADTKGAAFKEILNPWEFSGADMKDYYLEAMKSRPALVVKFLEDMDSRMNLSLNAVENLDSSESTKEIVKLQRKYLKEYVDYAKKLGDYNDAIYKILKEATESTIEDMKKDFNELKENKSFEDFYKYLSNIYKKNMDKLKDQEQVNKLVEKTLEAVSTFKEDAEKMMKEYRELTEVSRKSEVDSLKAEVQALKDKIAALEAKLDK